MTMEFWGVEVKAGEPLKVEQLDGILVHLSQASLGESKKDKANESVVLYVNVDGQKLVIGTLSPDKAPQISYDLVFEKEFELSHSWKNGSVYFLGYKAEMDEEEGEDAMFDSDSDSGSEDEEEEVPLAVPANGKPEPEAEKSKVVAAKAKAAKPDSTKAKDAKPDDDSDDGSDEEDDDSEEDSSDDEEMTGLVESDDEDEDEDEDEESSDEEAEAAPKNTKQNKKRAAESVANTPATQKKAKLVTPQKSGEDGKKGNAHTATPHPSKGGKANKKADKQSPKSGSQISCKTCSKTFNSDAAMQSHTKAKHGMD